MNTCPLPVSVMFLVQKDTKSIKGKTFFEQMGFQNRTKLDILASYKKLKINELSPIDRGDIEKLNRKLNELNETDTEAYEKYQSYMNKILKSDYFNPVVTISDVATWFYILCAYNHEITNDPLFKNTLKSFGDFISKQVLDIQGSQQLVPDPFVRPVSKKKYKFTISQVEDTQKYILVIFPLDNKDSSTSSFRLGGKSSQFKRNTRRIK